MPDCRAPLTARAAGVELTRIIPCRCGMETQELWTRLELAKGRLDALDEAAVEAKADGVALHEAAMPLVCAFSHKTLSSGNSWKQFKKLCQHSAKRPTTRPRRLHGTGGAFALPFRFAPVLEAGILPLNYSRVPAFSAT